MNHASDEILLEHKYLRCEFDWMAVDLEGGVGYFSTAGFGPIPEGVLRIGDQFEEIEGLLVKAKACTSALVVTNLKHDIGDWVRAAERGMYAFDWRNDTDSYELIARPADDPAHAACGSSEILELAERTLLSVRFSKTNSLRVGQGRWVSD